MVKKKAAERQEGRQVCPDCDGHGCMWSERSIANWAEQTPWFNRERMSPKPPESWRDRNCERCHGAGYLDKEGQPILDRLIDSEQRRVRRRRMETGAGEGQPREVVSGASTKG